MADNTSAAATTPMATTDSLSREEFLDLFVDVLRICEPDHPYIDTGPYDGLTTDDIEFSHCKKTSNTWARCGPRRGRHVALFAIDHSYFQSVSFERVLAVTVHEVTHITVGTHEGWRAAMHPPEFWNEMAFHAQLVLDHLDDLADKWGGIDTESFRQHIITDPNESMVDQRSDSVDDVRNRLTEWVGDYPANKCV